VPEQSLSGRTWLDVPFAEKDAAKAAGARWDPTVRRWYAPTNSKSLGRWVASDDLPSLLPGEDRSFGSGLFVDLVPSSCWFSNVRSCVSSTDWDRIRRMVYARAGHRCEACGAPADRANKRWLEAHERWEFLEGIDHPVAPNGRVQSLRRLVCLCTWCHQATHFGFASLQGREEQALDHLQSVNGWTRGRTRNHVSEAYAVWDERSKHEWALELGILLRAGVEPKVPRAA
jgi:hypothetical protein